MSDGPIREDGYGREVDAMVWHAGGCAGARAQGGQRAGQTARAALGIHPRVAAR